MAKRIPCCDCGTALIAHPGEPTTKLSLCSTCWNKLPAAVIIRRSKEHDAGHAVTCHAPPLAA